MKCKKEIMGFAALLVLLFHFYIPFGSSPVETFIYRASYIGVDMFFLVSAYSLSSNVEKNRYQYGKFLLNRLLYIYLPFVLMSIICAIYKKWEIMRLVKVVTGLEFFARGGGSFLWYFIGIMLIYLISPLFVYAKKKLGLLGFPALLLFWAVLVSVLQFGFSYTKPFILLNRLPIFIIGFYFDDIILKPLSKLNKKYQYSIEALLLISGIVLTYFVGKINHLNKPISEMFYIVAIPLTISIVLIFNSINKRSFLTFFGGITLELYGLQMIFGYDIESFLLKVLPVKRLAFVGTAVALTLIALLFNRILYYSREVFKK